MPADADDAARLTAQLQFAAQITSRLSHDFGNLLTAILGFGELAATQVPTGTVAHQYLGEVRDAAVDGAAWIRKLALFCRGARADIPATSVYGSIGEETRSDPALVVALPPNLPAIVGDAASLRQAVRQVALNAREATGRGEPITITASAVELDEPAGRALLGLPPAGRYVEIVVADRGPGLSAAAFAQLFREPFFSTKPRHRGLGLLMTYGIVHASGGGLRIQTGPGGTLVHLFFQAAE